MLANEGRHPKLVVAVACAAAAGSIREDLRSAREALRLIEKRDGNGQITEIRALDDETTVSGALFTHAVILYARATFTTGTRPRLLGDSGLSEEERETEKEIQYLRNSAIGHFGRGEALKDGPIIREAVLMSFTRTQRQIGVYTVRAQHKAGIGRRLTALIEVRLRQIAERCDNLFGRVDALLDTALRSDPALGPSLAQFEFDAQALCGTSEAAERLLAQLETGHVEDMDYAVPVRPQ